MPNGDLDMTKTRSWVLAGLVLVLWTGAARAQVETPPARFEASVLRVENLVGVLEVKIVDSAVMEVELSGKEELLEEIEVRVDEGVLVIEREKSLLDRPPKETFKWRDTYPTVTVRTPAGTRVEINEAIGQALIGDLAGPLVVNATWLAAEVGDVSEAEIEMSGRASLTLGRVAGALRAQLNSSGDFQAAALGTAEIRKSGSGDVRLGPIAGVLDYESSGSGDGEAASVMGPVEAELNGSGNLRLRGGVAEPLIVKINGSGDFILDGEAVGADLSVGGSGRVVLGGHRGTLRLREFTGTLTTGDDGSIEIAQ
jgi:hypothetical protein